MATSRPWSDLPIELVELIANRVDSFGTYIRFGTVCKSWRDVTANSRQLRALQPPPWLVTHVDGTKIVCFTENLQLYPVNMPLGNARCFGSSFGWLMMTNYCDGINYLLNPCNHQKIQLPRSRPKAADFFINSVLTSSPSIAATNRGDDIGVLAMNYYGKLKFCILGDEEYWSVNFQSDGDYADIIFFKGHLHGLTVHHQIVIFEFGNQQVHSHPYPHMEYLKVRPGSDDERLHLVESAGELLIVIRSWFLDDHPAPERNVDHDYDPDFMRTFHFSVYMLDSSVPRWVKVTSFGGRAVLVGEACSISVDAAKFSLITHRASSFSFPLSGYHADVQLTQTVIVWQMEVFCQRVSPYPNLSI